ncbi:nucleotidyltransferase family protein [Oscillospiraceae bacterium PP1C4]
MGKSLKLACIFLASGHSKRFHDNKLLSDFGGRPMVDVVLGNFPYEYFNQTVVVTRYAQVAVTAAEHGFTIVENDDETDDISKTIKLGLAVLAPDTDGCLFSVCDQPMLRPQSIGALVDAFRAKPDSIVALGFRGKRGNPVLFPRTLFDELNALEPNQSGGAVIAAHKELLTVVEASNRRELVDIDYRADLETLTHS